MTGGPRPPRPGAAHTVSLRCQDRLFAATRTPAGWHGGAMAVRAAGAASRLGAVRAGLRRRRRPDEVTVALAERARRRRAADPLGALTPRQREVVGLAVGGASNDEIAARLFVTRRTVESHLTGAFRTLGLRRRAQLAALAGGAGQPAGRTT